MPLLVVLLLVFVLPHLRFTDCLPSVPCFLTRIPHFSPLCSSGWYLLYIFLMFLFLISYLFKRFPHVSILVFFSLEQ